MRVLQLALFFWMLPAWAVHPKVHIVVPPSVTSKTIIIKLPERSNPEKTFDNKYDMANIMDKCDVVCAKNGLQPLSSRRMTSTHVECHCAN